MVLTDQASALYDPGVGRFCSRDPVGYADGPGSLVTYVLGNPGSLVDPIGLQITAAGAPRPPENMMDKNGCCRAKSVRMICRSMPIVYHAPLMVHCYLVFVDKDGNLLDTLSGQQSGERPNLLILSDTGWDGDYFRGRSKANQWEYPVVVEQGGSLCGIYDCLYKAAATLHGTEVYREKTNNSNSFLARIMDSCNTYASFPFWAWGRRSTGNCIKKCIFPLNLISVPEGRLRLCRDLCESADNDEKPYDAPDFWGRYPKPKIVGW